MRSSSTRRRRELFVAAPTPGADALGGAVGASRRSSSPTSRRRWQLRARRPRASASSGSSTARVGRPRDRAGGRRRRGRHAARPRGLARRCSRSASPPARFDWGRGRGHRASGASSQRPLSSRAAAGTRRSSTGSRGLARRSSSWSSTTPSGSTPSRPASPRSRSALARWPRPCSGARPSPSGSRPRRGGGRRRRCGRRRRRVHRRGLRSCWPSPPRSRCLAALRFGDRPAPRRSGRRSLGLALVASALLLEHTALVAAWAVAAAVLAALAELTRERRLQLGAYALAGLCARLPADGARSARRAAEKDAAPADGVPAAAARARRARRRDAARLGRARERRARRGLAEAQRRCGRTHAGPAQCSRSTPLARAARCLAGARRRRDDGVPARAHGDQRFWGTIGLVALYLGLKRGRLRSGSPGSRSSASASPRSSSTT